MNPFSIPVLCLTKNYIWHKNWNNGTNVFIFLNQKIVKVCRRRNRETQKQLVNNNHTNTQMAPPSFFFHSPLCLHAVSKTIMCFTSHPSCRCLNIFPLCDPLGKGKENVWRLHYINYVLLVRVRSTSTQGARLSRQRLAGGH